MSPRTSRFSDLGPLAGPRGIVRVPRPLLGWLAAVLAAFLGATGGVTPGRAHGSGSDESGAEVLTRGPVHEAFAGIVVFNPEPGVVVTKDPPDLIEEVPPEEKPEGDNVTWIPGYWGWDDERSDFLWVSGTWRALPPGREWMAGYWGQAPGGHQWVSGYWADATVREAAYLPPPPPTLEVGPSIASPSMDYGWTPGCWVWHRGRYAWRPGYWARVRADWDWIPDHYIWTPRGHLFVGGFWDYSIERRGVLFAPVYFEAGVLRRPRYHYSPTITIDLGVFVDHLFLRPRYHHYYFGDYYGAPYRLGGFHASFSFQSGRYGYDPIYSHNRWAHRQERGWERRIESSYQYRRDHETARPPRTWAAQRAMNPAGAESRRDRVLVATPADRLAQRGATPMRFQPVAREERQKLTQRGQDVQRSRDQRRTLEARPADPAVRTPAGGSEPARVRLPSSPIVAAPATGRGRGQTPPKPPSAPRPNRRAELNPAPPVRPAGVPTGQPQPGVRRSESGTKPAPGRSESPTRPRQIQPQPESRQRPSGSPTQVQAPPPSPAKRLQGPAQRVSEPAVRGKPDATGKGGATHLKAGPTRTGKRKGSPRE